MRWRRLPAVVLLAVGCTAPPPPPDPAERAATRIALEALLAGAPAEQAALRGETPARRLLRAVGCADRDARVAALEALADDSTDPLRTKQILHLLEQDDAWLVHELQGDRLYSTFAAAWNGLLRMGYAFLQANPVGVIRPLVAGIDRLVTSAPPDPGERKAVLLARRWLVLHPDGAGLPDGAAEVREQADHVAEVVRRQELLVCDDLLARGRLDAAAAHLHAARVRDPAAADLAERDAALETAWAARRHRLAAGLDVRPAEVEWVRAGAVFIPRYVAWIEGLLLGVAGLDDLAALAADVARHDRPGAAAVLVAPLHRLAEPRDALSRVRAAEAEHARRVRRYVFAGRPPSADPLDRYAEAARRLRRAPLDVLEPLLWIPATLARAVFATFGEPVDDRHLLDAEAALARSGATGESRDLLLLDLARRHARRGEHEKALAVARDLSLPEDELLEFAARATEAQVERARRAVPPEPGVLLPARSLAPFAAELGLAPDLVDGRAENGEIAAPGVRWHAGRLTFRTGAERAVRAVAVADAERPRLDALAEEWSWRRRAARAPTYRELHAGVPVEFELGIGAEGIGFHPRLLPEEYRLPDRSLYE